MLYLVKFPAGDFLSGPDGIPAAYTSHEEANTSARLFGGVVFPVRTVV